MNKTQLPTNFLKHTSKNPLQKLLIQNFYSTLISLAKPLSPKTILDAGCGEGFTLNRLSRSGIGEKLEGIESSGTALSLGKKIFPEFTFKHGSIYNLPYKDRAFDLVVCTEVLEHVNQPIKALREIFRVSKKHMIFSVPNEPFFIISNFLRGKNLSRLGNDKGHINHWNIFSFPKFLLKERLKIVKTKLPFPWIMIAVEKL